MSVDLLFLRSSWPPAHEGKWSRRGDQGSDSHEGKNFRGQLQRVSSFYCPRHKVLYTFLDLWAGRADWSRHSPNYRTGRRKEQDLPAESYSVSRELCARSFSKQGPASEPRDTLQIVLDKRRGNLVLSSESHRDNGRTTTLNAGVPNTRFLSSAESVEDSWRTTALWFF